MLSDRGASSTQLVDESDTPPDTTVKSFKVVAAPIDDITDGVAYTHIKMDIEGAEHEALSGAATTIREQHPALAISVYHCPDDLWRLPLLVDSIAPGVYDYYLRLEGHWGLETVCYAVPR